MEPVKAVTVAFTEAISVIGYVSAGRTVLFILVDYG